LPSLLGVCHLPGNDYRLRVPDVQAASMQARREPEVVARTATKAEPQLIAFVLPGLPASVPVARRRVRAALGSRGLGEYTDDAEIITSELVTNAVQHACDNGTKMIGVTLTTAGSPAAVTVAVSDSSPGGPIRRGTQPGSEQGRGLQIVAALSAHWGWRHDDGGKAVFAVLAREA
jgi:anti-sigma regulatory factor (Ser/Thr protein kinase)